MNDLSEFSQAIVKFIAYCQTILDVVEDASLRKNIEDVMSSVAYSSPETAYLHEHRLTNYINLYMRGKTKDTVTEGDIKILAAFTQKSVEEIIASLEASNK